MRLNLKFLVVFLVLGLNLKVNANEISNNALPTDPNITHGTAVISQGANQLTIDQQLPFRLMLSKSNYDNST